MTPPVRAHGRPPWPAPRVRRQSGVDQGPRPTCRSGVCRHAASSGEQESMLGTSHWTIFTLAVALLGAAKPEKEKDAWTVTKVQPGQCRLDSDKVSLSDGYQTTTVQVRVTPNEV